MSASRDRLSELRKALELPNRVRDLEGWRNILSEHIADIDDDLIKQDERMDAQDARIAKLELMLGIAIDRREREVEA